MNGGLEDELKQALARVEPPEGFTGRVLDRLPASRRKKLHTSRWLAIAAAIALAVMSAFYWRRQQEKERGLKAQQQLIYALRLTAGKLTTVDAHLKKSIPRLHIKKKEQL